MSVQTSILSREALGLKGKSLETKDHTLYYEVATNSDKLDRTFILCHGAVASGRYMNVIAEQLLKRSRNCKVIVIDLPFHGHSIASVDVKGLNINDYKKYTKEFVDGLQKSGELVGTVHWVGWSLGGSLGLLLNIQDGLFDELTLVNSAPYWESVDGLISSGMFDDLKVVPEVSRGIMLADLDGYDDDFVQQVIDTFDEVIAPPETAKNDFEAIQTKHFDVREELYKVTAKTLIFSGTLDVVADVTLQHLMHQKIQGSNLVLLEDTHAAVLKKEYAHDVVSAILATK